MQRNPDTGKPSSLAETQRHIVLWLIFSSRLPHRPALSIASLVAHQLQSWALKRGEV
jgi:hypothetical protein